MQPNKWEVLNYKADVLEINFFLRTFVIGVPSH